MSEIKAVLVGLSIPIMPNSREDKDLTEEFRQNKKLGRRAGKWTKFILPPHAFTRMRKTASDFRNQKHYKLTLPWEDGKQLLPAAAHDQYKAAAEEARNNFLEGREEFKARYAADYRVPAVSADAVEYFSLLESLNLPKPKVNGEFITIPPLVAQAKLMHNGTYNPALYPPWSKIQDRFGFEVEYTPVPRATHFLEAGIAEEEIEAMKQELETRNVARVNAAVEDVWLRLLAPVKHIADILTSPETIFRDTLIGNVKEIVALIPQLNLTNDADLRSAAREIETKLTNLDPDLLRSDVTMRKEAGKAAKQLVAAFGKIGKRRFA